MRGPDEQVKKEPVQLSQLGSAAKLAELRRKMLAERGSLPIAPTHLLERAGEIVGYASLAAIPVLTGWLSDDKVTPSQGREVIAQLEALAKEKGCRFLMFPCTEDCRFLSDMEPMEYRQMGANVRLFFKKL